MKIIYKYHSYTQKNNNHNLFTKYYFSLRFPFAFRTPRNLKACSLPASTRLRGRRSVGFLRRISRSVAAACSPSGAPFLPLLSLSG